MKKVYPLIIVSILLLLVGCGPSQKETIAYSSELLSTKVNTVEITSSFESATDGLRIAGMAVDTLLSNVTNSQEIRVSFEAALGKELLKTANSLGYNAIFINTYLFTNGIKHNESKVSLFKSRSEQTSLTSGFVFENEDKRQFELEFPYRLLQLKKGEQELKFCMEIYGATFRKDTVTSTSGYFETLSKSPLATHITKFKVIAPQLYEFKIKVLDIILDTTVVNPSEYDVRYLGPGYPDLCWQVKIGTEVTYTSPVMDNCIRYERKGQTKALVGTAHDFVTVSVLDYDDTSDHDRIEEIGKMLFEFQQSPMTNMPYGNLKKINYQIESKLLN